MNNSWATNGSPEMGEKKIERKQWRRGWRGRREKWCEGSEGRKKERVSLQPQSCCGDLVRKLPGIGKQ